MRLKDEYYPTDQEQRRLIDERTDLNLFVEASAGSGKTTKLVDRMIAMVLSGIPISQISAITYTKAAANEFYERFQTKLGKLSSAETDSVRLDRLQKAIKDIDLCFMGTIDSFCARILSEHPNEAHLPMGASVVSDEEQSEIASRFYREISNGLHGSELKEKADRFVSAVGDPKTVFSTLVKDILGHRDHQYETLPVRTPAELQKDSHGLFQIFSDIHDYVADKNKKGKITKKDSVQKVSEYETTADHPALEPEARKDSGTYISDNLKALIFDLNDFDGVQINDEIDGLYPDAAAWFEGNVSAENWDHTSPFPVRGAYTLKMNEVSCQTALKSLRDQAYALSFDLCLDAASLIAEYMRANGKLSYFSSLYYLRNMLREDAAKGGSLISHISSRHRYYLIDEFQDTDPIQSEIFFYLAAEAPDPDWKKCLPRPGALFIVGDPKQSIYAFKGSDAKAFAEVQSLFDSTEGCEQVGLAFNFRSSYELCSWFDTKFTEIMGLTFPCITDGTPPAGLMAVPADCVNGCWRIESERKTKGAPEAAQLVRSLVSDPKKLICPDPSEPPRRIEYSDIMIITVSKEDTDKFRNALRALGIPAVVEGSVSFVSSLALAELTKLIAAASDMNDGIALCAALTGRLIGLTETRLASVGRSDKAIAAVKEDAPKKKDPERKDTGYVKPLTFYINADEPEKYFDKAADADILSAVKILTAVKLDACNMPASAVIQKAADDLRVFEKLGDDEMQFYTFALELLRDKEKTGEVTSLKEAADYLNGLLASNRSEERSLSLVRKPNAVHIANLHKVKGLESPIVILGTVYNSKSISPSNYSFADAEGRKKRIIFKVGGSGDKKNTTYISTTVFDKYKDTAKENELDEYRRLHYVAATRAKCALFVCDKPEKPPKTTKTGKPAKKKCDPLDKRLPSYWKALTVDEDCSVMPLYTIDPKGDKGGAEAFDREDLYKKAEDDSLLKNKDERQKITREFEKPHEEKLGSSAGSDKPSEDGEQSDPAAPAPAASADDKPRRFTSLAANKKGSFVHKLMELLVLSKGRAAGSIPTLIDRILDEADFEMTPVQEADCRTMLSEVADVMLNKGGYKQYGGAPQDLLPELWSAEKIYCELPICYEEYNTIVYGIIDMLYVSGGKWHIIDYKTDRDAAAAPAVHAGQLERYRQALIRINGIPAGDIDAHVYNVDIS